MKHLSASECVDCAEGVLESSRGAHVTRCDVCRVRVQSLRDTLQRTSGIGSSVPEPSPLFWEHFSARVREQVAARALDHAHSRPWLPLGRLVPMGAALALVLVVSSLGLLTRDRAPVAAPVPVAVAPAADAALDASIDATIDADSAEAWNVLTAAADDLQWDAAHAAGMGVQPAALDGAVQRLSPAELTELGRLLQAELKHAGAGN